MPDRSKLTYLRRLRAAGAITDAERAELDHADNVYGDGWWLTTQEARFRANTKRVAVFRDAHGRWPSQMAADEDEQFLGRWLVNQRRAIQTTSRPDAERWEHLNTVLPGWLPDRETVWLEQARAVADFRTNTGRWPRKSSDDERELALFRWLTRQGTTRFNGRKGLSDQRREALDTILPGWNTRRARAHA